MTFTDDEIVKTINRLNPNKTNGHDMIRMCMIKLRKHLMCGSLDLTLRVSLDEGVLLTFGKKPASILPVNRNNDKQ